MENPSSSQDSTFTVKTFQTREGELIEIKHRPKGSDGEIEILRNGQRKTIQTLPPKLYPADISVWFTSLVEETVPELDPWLISKWARALDELCEVQRSMALTICSGTRANFHRSKLYHLLPADFDIRLLDSYLVLNHRDEIEGAPIAFTLLGTRSPREAMKLDDQIRSLQLPMVFCRGELISSALIAGPHFWEAMEWEEAPVLAFAHQMGVYLAPISCDKPESQQRDVKIFAVAKTSQD